MGAPSGEGSAHRADIQGLRAVAVLLVALGHAGVRFLRGGYIGVDVFFVLSGFLITGLLVAEARRRHFVSLADFYLRRARRILPAALLTVLATDIAAYQLLNIVRARQYLQDSIPSTLFAANIHFASIGTDYFSRGQPPSPFQHFWSLAVEEQFYIVWPGLFILLLGLSFRRYAPRPDILRERAFRRVMIVVAALALGSVAWSIHYTSSNPAAAYFSTPARIWELGLGALLALAGPSLAPVARRWGRLIGWGGLALILVAAVAFSSSTPFPGYAALLPTVGAALFIAAGVAGQERVRGSAGRLLGLRPVGFVGDRSYAFYLWHWPVLVIAAQYKGHGLSVTTNLLLLAGAFALSVISYKLYERPLRYTQFARKPQVAYVWVSGVVVVLALATAWTSSIDNRVTQENAAAAATQLPVLIAAPTQTTATSASSTAGTSAAGPPSVAQTLPAVTQEVNLEHRHRAMPAVLVPPVGELLRDLPQGIPASCLADTGQTSSRVCRLGDSASSRTIVVLGDSHAQVWLPDVISLGQREHWAVIPLIKEGCSPHQWLHSANAPYCPPWLRWAMHEAATLSPTVALIAGSYTELGPTLHPDTLPGLDAAVHALKPHAKHVVILGDVPPRQRQPVDCLLASNATPAGCAEPLSTGDTEQTAQVGELAGFDKVAFIDPTGWFCALGECPLVVGNAITYRDDNHISQTYATELSLVLRGAFNTAIAR